MRVVVGLLLLACCGGLVSVSVLADTINADGTNTFHVTGGDGSVWTIGGSSNPTLAMTIGTTYNIYIEFPSTNHPFGLNTSPTSTVVADNGLINQSCEGSVSAGYYTGSSCILTFTPTAQTPQPLYYHCVEHPNMVGQILVSAATTAAPTTAAPTTADPTTAAPTTAAPTTADPTTAAPTTVAPTNNTNNATTSPPTTTAPTTVAPTNNTANATTVPPTTAAPTTVAPTTTAPTTPAPVTPVANGTLVGSSFRITGNTATSAYLFTAPNGTVYSNPTLNVTAGSTVTISLEYTTFHPLGFSNNSNPTAFSLLYDFPVGYQDYTLNAAANCNTSFSSTVKTARMATFNITNPQPCVITIKVPTIDVAAPILYYRCARHSAMIGTINVIAPAASGTTAPPSGTTAPPKANAAPTTVSVFGTGMTLLVAVFAMLMA